MADYELVVGLEVHAELLTESKMFCGCEVVDSTAAAPNLYVCEVCTAQPGVLPVINAQALDYAIMVGLALHCRINDFNQFARKSYFYPDLPKGYQISQYEYPLASDGWLDIMTEAGEKRIGVTRAHLEEDTGKSFHKGDYSLVDLNRAGVPLLEIVSEPDFRTLDEIESYARKLRQILVYLGVNHGDMSKGVLRFEANVSVRPEGSDTFNTRTEIKNLNSIRSLVRAVRYEAERQKHLHDAGEAITQQTMGFDEDTGETFTQRIKERADDYRYFPEPDLPPVFIGEEWVERIQATMPELPDAKLARFITDYGLRDDDAAVLVADKAVADYYETSLKAGPDLDAMMVANWLTGEFFRLMNADSIAIEDVKITSEQFAALLMFVEDGTINANTGKDVLTTMFSSGRDAADIVEAGGLAQISDTGALEVLVDQIIADNLGQVESYLGGKDGLLGWFVGQVMRETKGQANAQMVNALFRERLEAHRSAEADTNG